MILRCVLDGLLLPATIWPTDQASKKVDPVAPSLWAFDGEEGFSLEALEALYYELVAATPTDLAGLERAGYRLLRRSSDFRMLSEECREKIGSCP